MSDLRDIDHDVLRSLIGTACHGKAGLAEGTNAATIKTATAVTYSIAGKAYSKAATDNLAFSAGHAVQADGTTRYYGVALDSSGAIVTTQGDAGGEMPEKVSGTCLIGFIKVVCSGGAFTPGTTDLSAAGVTATYLDVTMKPLATTF